MTDDSELLRRYAEEKSEEAFRELVQRHIDLVYAAAIRLACGNAAMAEDCCSPILATDGNWSFTRTSSPNTLRC